MTLRTLNYGNYGIFLILGNAGFCPSAVVTTVRIVKLVIRNNHHDSHSGHYLHILTAKTFVELSCQHRRLVGTG